MDSRSQKGDVPPEEYEFRIRRMEERYLLARCLIVCSAILFGVWHFLDVLGDLVKNSAWNLIALIVTLVAAAFFPQLPAILVNRARVRKWTKSHVAREAELEQLVDERRTSSGLTPEGDDPPKASQ